MSAEGKMFRLYADRCRDFAAKYPAEADREGAAVRWEKDAAIVDSDHARIAATREFLASIEAKHPFTKGH